MQSRNECHQVWIVDDNADHAELLTDMIREKSPGMQIHHIVTGEAALQQLFDLVKINAPLPELIFMDIKMPRKNGIETLVEIKNANNIKNIPVVMLSSSTNELEINSSLRAGALLYIAKPLSGHYFVQHILPIIKAQGIDIS